MNKQSIGMLLGLNVVLLIALALTTLTVTPAVAQFGQRGNYVMISGEATGRETAAVYLLDLKSQKMAAVMFDSRNKRLQFIAGRDVTNDMQARHGR